MRNDRFYEATHAIPFQRHIFGAACLRTSNPLPAARRDPFFTPLFTAGFASIGISAGTAAFLGSVTTAIVTTSVLPGCQLV